MSTQSLEITLYPRSTGALPRTLRGLANWNVIDVAQHDQLATSAFRQHLKARHTLM
jgi:hypothetical protein